MYLTFLDKFHVGEIPSNESNTKNMLIRTEYQLTEYPLNYNKMCNIDKNVICTNKLPLAAIKFNDLKKKKKKIKQTKTKKNNGNKTCYYRNVEDENSAMDR